jgi:CubicO group peptidase (beta-lactamase class C family)
MRTRPVASLSIVAASLAAPVLLALLAHGASGAQSERNVPTAQTKPPGHPHLDRLRLLPPVLVSGEKGWGLEERMKRYKVEAVSVAVFGGGRILWSEAAGLADRETGTPATTETLFQAGSISKPVAASGVLRKVESGALRLDADVNDYLKSWKLPSSPAAAGQTVTLERLLSHTAGLTVHGFPGYAVGEEVPTIPQVLDGASPANTEAVRVTFQPGTKYQYSGGGFTIAQLAMTDTFGKPFPDLERELVLGPAGMTHSTYEQPLPPAKLALAAAGYRADGRPVEGKRHTYPEMAAAGLWTTPEDLLRFAIAIERSLGGQPGALLSKETARRMTTPVRDRAGLGLFLDEREGTTWFGHDGADEGFQALLVASRDGDCRCGIAVMANSDNGIRLGQEIVRGVARDSEWKYLPAPIVLVKRPIAELAPVAGRFLVNGDEAVSITLRDGRLFGAARTPAEFELLPVAKDAFVRTDRNLRYEVDRTAQGRVVSIRLVSPDGSTPAKRIGDEVRIPSEDLEAGRLDDALAGYRRLHAASPSDPAVAEGRLNDMGYRLAATGRRPQGVALLKLVTELYPTSANAWDSYSEVSLAAGDRATARSAAQKVLEVLPSDPKTDAAVKERLRAIAEKRIADLSAPRS